MWAHYSVPESEGRSLPSDARTSADSASEEVEVSRQYFPDDVSIPKDAVITEDISMDVTWNRDAGWVQMSLDIPRKKWEENYQFIAQETSISSRALYTDILTRTEINNLIKTLRRARDAAYGADE